MKTVPASVKPSESIEKAIRLEKIETTVALLGKPRARIPATTAKLIAQLSLLLSFMISIAVAVLFQPIDIVRFLGLAIALAALIALLLAVFVYFTSEQYETWADFLARQLRAYHPVDPAAYAALQERTKGAGVLSADSVLEWLHIERGALQALSDPVQRFIAKKIS